jgi:hypothetical protein
MVAAKIAFFNTFIGSARAFDTATKDKQITESKFLQ